MYLTRQLRLKALKSLKERGNFYLFLPSHYRCPLWSLCCSEGSLIPRTNAPVAAVEAEKVLFLWGPQKRYLVTDSVAYSLLYKIHGMSSFIYVFVVQMKVIHIEEKIRVRPKGYGIHEGSLCYFCGKVKYIEGKHNDHSQQL